MSKKPLEQKVIRPTSETDLTGHELVQAYQGLLTNTEKQIRALEGQPGQEEELHKLQQQRIKIMQRGAEVPAGDVATVSVGAAPGVAKDIDPLQKGLMKMFSDREYRVALPSEKRKMREQAYDQYITPYFKQQGKTPPDRNYFVDRLAPDVTQPLIDIISTGKGPLDFAVEGSLYGSAVEAAKGTTQMARSFWYGLEHLGGYYLGMPVPKEQIDKTYIAKVLTKAIDSESDYLGQHYADDVQSRFVKGVGRYTPDFVAWGLAEAGEAAAGLGKLAPNIFARFAERRAINFANGFLISKLEEKDNKESAETGGIAAGLGIVGDFFGKVATWLGPKKAGNRIITDANRLLEQGDQLKLGKGGGPIITPPPTEIIPPQGELPGLLGRRQLPPAGSIQAPPSGLPPTRELPRIPGRPQLPPARGIQAPASSVLISPQGLLRSGVEGAKKPIDFLSQANFRILNQATREVSGGKFKAFAMAPDSVRNEALKKVGYVFAEAIKEAPANNPDFIAASAKAKIAEQSAKVPAFKQIIDMSAQVTKQDPAKVVADHVTEMAKKEQAFKHIQEVAQSIGPGAQATNEAEVIMNIKNLLRAKIGLQGHQNQIAFAWARRDTLPDDVKGIVAQQMKELFGSNPKQWDAAAKTLDEHIDNLIKKGHIPPTDLRGVFRSTNLTGSPTKWQQALAKEPEVANLAKKMNRTTKKFGPGAADIDDPAFNNPKDPQAMNRRIAEHISKTDAERQRIEDERLRAAFGAGKADTDIHQKVIQSLFPGRSYASLTPAEQSKVNQMAAAISKGRKR